MSAFNLLIQTLGTIVNSLLILKIGNIPLLYIIITLIVFSIVITGLINIVRVRDNDKE